MQTDPRQVLARVPAANRTTAYRETRSCKICGSGSVKFDIVDFNKWCSPDNFYAFGLSGVSVDYWRCVHCGFLFTDFFDNWTNDDFRRFIYNDDYLKMDGEYTAVRPARIAEDFGRRLQGAENARILDYGSGAGVFVQQMRERGFHHVEGYDPFSSPERPQGRFDIITCFEVIEHTGDPRATLADMLGFLEPDGCILLSQTLQPDDILERRGNWWYLAPRNGHISTFTEEALELMARSNGLLLRRGDTVFGLAGQDPSRFAQIGLQSVGPSFSTVRVHAPTAMPDSLISFTDRKTVWWHPMKTEEARQFRWTGGKLLQWQAKWPEVACLRVHVPLVSEIRANYAAACKLALDGVVRPVRMVRGEMTAEFDVTGKTAGRIELRTPPPVETTEGSPECAKGIAIATANDPIWPAPA